MLAVGIALKRWREQHPTLAALGLKCSLSTDPDAKAPEGARSVLTLRFEASETRAVVPFTVSEELKAARTEDLPSLVEAVTGALNGRAYLIDPDAAIHRLSLRSVAFSLEPGLAGVANLEWEGLASW